MMATDNFRPAFRKNFHLSAIPGDGFFLISETDAFVLEGAVLSFVVPLIDGRRTVGEIIHSLSSVISGQEVRAAIDLLIGAGHVHEHDPTMPYQFAAFWSEMGVETHQLSYRFASAHVQVLSLDGHSPTEFIATLRSFGLNVTDHGQFLVVFTEDYLEPRLQEINAQSLARGVPWLLVKPNGVHIWVGPIFIPNRNACWLCLENRLRENREAETYIAKKLGTAGLLPIPRPRLTVIRQQAYSIATLQILRWMATSGSSPLESRILTTNTMSLEYQFHEVVRRPQCPACGDPRAAWVAGRPIHLLAQSKTSLAEGGERHVPPEITYARFSHHVSPITGIVRALLPSPWNGQTPLRSYTAGTNFALKSDKLFFLKQGLRTHSSGKGRSDAQAKTSALCEALERYSGVFRGEEERIRGSYRDLGDSAIHPNDCMLYSEKQFTEREEWMRRGSRFQIVPLPFDEQAQIEWSPLYSLTQKRVKYLPTSYLYYGYPVPDGHFFCWADSNGNAAGNTVEEACLQGFYEVVERDSVCIWWYNRLQRPRVRLEEFDDPFIEELHNYYASVDREFWVLDISSDLGIPSFAAINRRVNGPTEDLVMGFGAHSDASIGVQRALTEMNQFMPAVLSRSPDGTTMYAFDDPDAIRWWQGATVANQHYLRPLSEKFDRRPKDYTPCNFASILDTLLACISIAEKNGMEVLIHDQSRPDVGLSVAKVVIPGMRHFWARFAPGRLYDVPVSLGWQPQPTAESDLNPIAMFL
jgi:oxazoline/thiazoline synthase